MGEEGDGERRGLGFGKGDGKKLVEGVVFEWEGKVKGVVYDVRVMG